MNKAGVGIISFLIGAAAGGAAGYFIGKAKAEAESVETVAELREEYRRRSSREKYVSDVQENTEKEPYTENEPEVTEESEKGSFSTDSAKEAAEGFRSKETVPHEDYTKYGKNDKVAEKIAEASAKKEKKKADISERTHPYLLEEDEYYSDRKFEKRVVTYFPDDEVFMYDDETVEDNGMMMIGAENLEHFGEFDNPEEIFVRNDEYGIDFNVILEEGSYADWYNAMYGEIAPEE